MDCLDGKCLCKSICDLNDKCVIEHRLFDGYRKSVVLKIKMTKSGIGREKVIIDLLQAFQPPKVNRLQVDNYYKFLRRGINFDNPKHLKRIMPRTLIHHKQLGIKSASKNIRKLLNNLKSDEARNKRSVAKNRKSIVAQYLEGNNVDPTALSKEEKKVVYREAAKKIEERLDKSGKPIIVISNDK
jgi:hypothetical protein